VDAEEEDSRASGSATKDGGGTLEQKGPRTVGSCKCTLRDILVFISYLVRGI
jgi:hypothetical protein